MAKHNLVIDIESTGPYPNPYSMIQIGAVDLNGNEFYGEFRPPIGVKYDTDAMDAMGLTIAQVEGYPIFGKTMCEFRDFIKETYKGQRPTTWSDNPAFDWQFVNHGMWSQFGENPLGFSMRRIGDFYAGTVNDVRKASAWKRMRTTKHTHNALDDAKGNAGALEKILTMSRGNK